MKGFRPAAVAWLLLLGVPAAAQPVFPAGTRVRVLVADSAATHGRDASRGWVAGSVVTSPPPALVLDASPPPNRISFALGELRRVDVSRGRPDRRWTGAIIGGLLSGAAFTGAVCAFSDGSCDITGGFFAYYAVGAVPGAIVGGAMGARHPGKERWEQAWPVP